MSRKDVLLISIAEGKQEADQWEVIVNSENFALASLLCKQICDALH
jgi:hypothetical protein